MGELIRRDTELFRKRFKEMAKLRGIRVMYQYMLNNYEYSIHSELKAQYSAPMPLDIIFFDYNNQKTLKRLGWFSENADDKPYVAQVPYDTPYLQKGCRIIMGSATTPDFKVFRIEDIQTIMQFPDSWWVKLAPEFEDAMPPEQHDYTQSDFKFLKQGDDV